MLAAKRNKRIKECDNNSHNTCTEKCEGCVCVHLKNLSQDKGSRKYGILLKDKGANEPISLDGTGMPTVFFFDKLDKDSCCIFFRFEDMSGTTPMTTVWKTFIVDCQSLSGFVISEEHSDSLIGSEF
ncbi:hypothetical protein [Bacillus mesophilum]|uniref:Uncharacterized protein n=1 Tax=Bacillus mesophilum TaxID=1071718 RepID=A0A7V7UX75_9BACI|nr:hypothetical protein [Bacillus mesophilum]KAB2335576.1 hypothetical protein F7732_03110 [Bacillus mesophilum]